MTASTRTTIKAFFETGDKPTQSNFSDFIDSCAFLAEGSAQVFNGSIGVSATISANKGEFATVSAGTATFNSFSINTLNATTINATTVSATNYTGNNISIAGIVSASGGNFNTLLTTTASVADNSRNVATTAFTKKTPTIQTFLSGSGTYTTPAGALWLKIRMVGGGGGGGGTSGTGGTGGTTIFNSINANGGTGGNAPSGANGGTGGAGGTGGTGSATIRLTGGKGTDGSIVNASFDSGAQGVGAGSFFGGSGGFGAGITNTGGGGAGASSTGPTVGNGGGGGAGEYVEIFIANPSATYSYTVGTAGLAGTGSGFAGGSGIIIVEEYYIG